MDDQIIRLMKRRKKGLLGIIFSRFGLAVLLILLQLALMVAVVFSLDEHDHHVLAITFSLFSFVMLFYLYNVDMDATAKMTWLLLLFVLPVPTAIMLFIVKSDIGNRTVKRRVNNIIDETRGILKQDEEALMESGIGYLSNYLNKTGCFPIYDKTDVRFFPLGEDKFEAMLEELKKAEKFIFMEYFIIDEGYMWGSILKVLADKAKEGVDVRVMYDGMCEIALLSHDYPARMAKLGIKCKPFTPIRPFVSTQYNYRDHRKILVIDGKVAFNGGVNLGDEYINRIERFGHWKDTALMLTGDAVKSFTLMFLQMWNTTEENPTWDEIEVDYKAAHDGYVLPYGDEPFDNFKAGETVYVDMLYRAKKYVHIMTPYLILDNELEEALRFAALRGVDVKIIVPGIPDKKAAYAIAKTHFKCLTAAGVKIYEYTPGFVHAKVCVSDDEKAVVGTINMDYRSLYHHFECATYMHECSCIADIEADYKKTLEVCTEVTEEMIRNEKLKYKIMGRILKPFATLM